MSPQTVRVELGSRSYDIVLTSENPHEFGAFALERCPRAKLALVVGDANTIEHAHAIERSLATLNFRTRIHTLPPGESTKSQVEASHLYDSLYEMAADRQTVVVAVGGGVVGDLAGFVAATYNRGLPLFMVPTTLLAMVDSSVGGKTAINHAKGKNLIGVFHQPDGVWIDIGTLTSLPEREFRSGLAEVVKYGVILDPAFFAELEVHAAAIVARDKAQLMKIVARSCELKASVVTRDEREETGVRAILNYGHTFAHAFETVGGYGSWLHGEAVAAGMVCASRLAEHLGLIESKLTHRQIRLLEAFELPTRPKPEWPIDELIAVMHRDKKALAGRMRFILPTKLGEVKLCDDVPESLVREVLAIR